MDEKLPYEDDLLKRLNDLPLPNEDMAWEDMQRRLDKDDDDGALVPPVFKGCGGYALLLLLFIIAGLLVVDPGNWFHRKEINKTVQKYEKKKNETADRIGLSHPDSSLHYTNNKRVSTADSFSNRKNITTEKTNELSTGMQKVAGKKTILVNGKEPKSIYSVINKKAIKGNHSLKKKNNNLIVKNNDHVVPVTKNTKGKFSTVVSGNLADDTIISVPGNIKQEGKIPAINNESILNVFSKSKPHPDTVKKKLSDTTHTVARPDSIKPGRLSFSAGIAIHQLLPVAGQKTNPYNSLGRKSSLGDYIPSVYLRMYKDKKWFVQSEFRYGAPQYTKQIVFNQKKIVDTGTASTIATSSSIKKTFYHQVPVSFNYFILPDFSVGAGLTLNKFKSALVQQDVHKIQNITQLDSLVSTALVSQKKSDSNFVTTYLQALVEIQYKWKRFSGGARYSFGIQPYLKFKLPGGEERKEKNSALQLFIRYELWRSEK